MSSADDTATVTVDWRGSRLVVTLAGEIDRANADAVGDAIRRSAAAATAVVIDLGGLTYFDSAGLAMLHLLVLGDLTVRVVAPSTCRAHRLLLLAAMDTVLDLHPSVDSALASISLPDQPAASV